MNTHTYTHHFAGLSIIATLLLLAFVNTENSHAESFENDDYSISQHGGDFEEATSFVLAPKNQKKIHWSFFRNNPSNLRSTTEATRIFVPRSRNFYIFSDTSAVEKVSFKIHQETENRFFRIHSIDSNPETGFLPTITVENASSLPFQFSMQGWKISGEGFEISLPDEALAPGEKRTFIADILPSLKEEFSEIILTSPTERVRDRVKVPFLEQTQIYIRAFISGENEKQQIRNTRPEFTIQEK